jgi:hypothetical protein
MFRLFLFFVVFQFSCVQGYSQYAFGFGAALHRYDQVVSLKGLKNFEKGNLGMDLGLGVERSLQGALAPQIALFWQAPISLKNRHNPMNMPIYSIRYQFDVQKAGITDTYHGLYLGLGYAFGAEARADLQFSVGFVGEKIYGLASQAQQKVHFFLNPQLQFNYDLISPKK